MSYALEQYLGCSFTKCTIYATNKGYRPITYRRINFLIEVCFLKFVHTRVILDLGISIVLHVHCRFLAVSFLYGPERSVSQCVICINFDNYAITHTKVTKKGTKISFKSDKNHKVDNFLYFHVHTAVKYCILYSIIYFKMLI